MKTPEEWTEHWIQTRGVTRLGDEHKRYSHLPPCEEKLFACRRCGWKKPFDDFYKNENSKKRNAKSAWCKVCREETGKA